MFNQTDCSSIKHYCLDRVSGTTCRDICTVTDVGQNKAGVDLKKKSKLPFLSHLRLNSSTATLQTPHVVEHECTEAAIHNWLRMENMFLHWYCKQIKAGVLSVLDNRCIWRYCMKHPVCRRQIQRLSTFPVFFSKSKCLLSYLFISSPSCFVSASCFSFSASLSTHIGTMTYHSSKHTAFRLSWTKCDWNWSISITS